MAITFLEQKKKQRYMAFTLGILILATAFIVWLGFLRKSGTPVIEVPVIKPPEVKIDWSALANPFFEKIQPVEEAKPLEGQAGRENPFLPY